jgi:glutathione S-transferase
MIVLCGFAASNYYNKVKLALLEKAIPFEEKLQWPDRSAELLAQSPLGKLPYFEIDGQALCESQVMVDYLESAYPQTPLLPKDPLAGGKASDERKALAHKQLKRSAKALAQLVSFDPYIAGSEFGLADCAAAVHLPIISMTTKAIYGEDVLAEYPLKEYLKRLAERPSVQQVSADRKENTELMREWRASLKG